MKPAVFVIAGLVAATLINSVPVVAAAEHANTLMIGRQKADEFSAAKKRRMLGSDATYIDALTGEIINPHRPRYIVPSHDFIGGPDGYPGEYAVRRAAGQCVMDFGYGRWRAC